MALAAGAAGFTPRCGPQPIVRHIEAGLTMNPLAVGLARATVSKSLRDFATAARKRSLPPVPAVRRGHLRTTGSRRPQRLADAATHAEAETMLSAHQRVTSSYHGGKFFSTSGRLVRKIVSPSPNQYPPLTT